MKTTQLLYVTTDQLGRRTVSVTTVFHPLHTTSSARTRVVSYQTAYDTLGPQCDPSYTIQAGTLGEPSLILGYVATGYTLVISDYEGEDHALGAGQDNSGTKPSTRSGRPRNRSAWQKPQPR